MESAKKKKKILKKTASSFYSKLIQKVPKIKRFQWSNIDMKNAIAAVENSLMSQREAALQFCIPRSTLGKYFRGDLVLGVRPGPTPILSSNLEIKLVEYAATRATIGFVFGKRQCKKRYKTPSILCIRKT